MDLVDLRSASTVMRARVLRSGVVILDRDPTARAFWEVWTTSAGGAGSMPDDVALKEAATIERRLGRARAETADAGWAGDVTR